MELGILGAVALLGYGLASSGKRPVARAAGREAPGCTLEDAQANNRISEREGELYDANFQAAMASKQTGIVPPGLAPAFDAHNRALTANQLRQPGGLNCNPAGPFYRSEKTMATSDAYKQNRLELFTGELDACRSRTGTYGHKRETGPLFAPGRSAAPVSFSGRQAYVDLRGAQDEEMFQLGNKYDGVGPVDPLRVGPGLGLDPSVPAAGGYQQFYRVYPENANSYRKTTLPGRTIPGMAPVGGAATVGLPTQRGEGKTVWDTCRRPLQEARASATGQAVHGAHRTRAQPEPVYAYAGNASRQIGAQGGAGEALQRVRADDRFTGFTLNAAGRSAAGGYQRQEFVDPGTFREPPGPLPLGAPRGWDQGGFAAAVQNSKARPTQREQGGAAPNVGATHPATAPRNQAARPTQRNWAHPAQGAAYAGGAPALTLDAGVDVDKPDYTCGYMPGAAAANQWNPNQPGARLRRPPNAARVEQGGMTSVNYGEHGENTSCMNKVPIKANLDLGLAGRVLSGNQLTHPLPWTR